MDGFDDNPVFFSSDFSRTEDQNYNMTDLLGVKFMFKEFLKQFHSGNFNYKYRDELKRNCSLRQFYLDVLVEDLASFDESLEQKLYKEPAQHLPLFEEAAKDYAEELTSAIRKESDPIQNIQITLSSEAIPAPLRSLKSSSVSRLVKISGIVISATGIKTKASKITLQCKGCGNVIPKISIKPGLDGYALPRKCNSDQSGQNKCPLDPYQIRADQNECIDFQIIKLQESTESVPHGEMPRHLMLYIERNLCERVVPGNRVNILGIYSIKRASTAKSKKGKQLPGVRAPYLRVVGIQLEGAGGISSSIPISPDEEDLIRRLAASPNIYDKLSNSIAPSIYGFQNVKKAVACLLIGGSRKRLPDGLTRRGDINILLLGDPGTAKSQLLKFVHKVSPIGVYTSGKGSSAAGLTASVVRDPFTRGFIVEGGAMVLADGGVVCIDEFDKMREDDRVAIHEAMEQQTISIAKAGITTTLNSRCSVMAAANSVYGRWDDTKGEDNIHFMPTILSRFDMIFIIRDIHNESRDITVAKHVLNVHIKAGETTSETEEGELSLDFLKKFIHYCRFNCGPRLSSEACEKLRTRYVLMRSDTHRHEMEREKQSPIPITVRQLEAVVRISESLAKMQLLPFATESHVDEALRLFQVSTLDAAISGTLTGADEFTSLGSYDDYARIEKQLKRRLAVGVQVSEHTIVNDFIKQKYPEVAIKKVINIMVIRGELVYRMQRKLLLRVR